MKNKSLIIGVLCLLLTIFAFIVYAEWETYPPTRESRQTSTQMSQGDFPQVQPPQGGRGQIPDRGIEEMPNFENTEQSIPTQTDETTTTQKSTQEDIKTAPVDDAETQAPETNFQDNMGQTGEFNTDDMGNFPFGQNGETTQKSEKPYEKWITPIYPQF